MGPNFFALGSCGRKMGLRRPQAGFAIDYHIAAEGDFPIVIRNSIFH